MADFCGYLYVTWTLSLICCLLWIFSPAEGNTVTHVVGQTVTLQCHANSSTINVSQLTWKMNQANLITFKPKVAPYIYKDAKDLNINMSLSERQLYALVIDRAQMSHTGNYTCEINTLKGVWEKKWELIITEQKDDNKKTMQLIAVAVSTPCVCCLTFTLVFIVLRKIQNRRAEKRNQDHCVEMQHNDDTYENCLEIRATQNSKNRQPQPKFKPRAH